MQSPPLPLLAADPYQTDDYELNAYFRRACAALLLNCNQLDSVDGGNGDRWGSLTCTLLGNNGMSYGFVTSSTAAYVSGNELELDTLAYSRDQDKSTLFTSDAFLRKYGLSLDGGHKG
jgi:hypothetical protein